MKRRIFLATGVAAAIALLFSSKPRDAGGAHNDYFLTLSKSLKDNDIFKPSMVLELDTLDRNIDALKEILNPKVNYRIVVKSLPSLDILNYVMARANTNRLMVFHQPFLNLIAKTTPSADVLIGKPMPVGAARKFYRELATDAEFNAQTQLQWLIDSPERLTQYLALARQVNKKFRVNFEIDVGLHRGGLSDTEVHKQMLDVIAANPASLEFSGFMGYDPHVVKLPSIIKSQDEAYAESQAVYADFIEATKAHSSNIDMAKLCLNGAGSPSLLMHKENTVCNELSAGSALVKPTDFDLPSLSTMNPAAFIATPIIKKSKGVKIPGLEKLSRVTQAWNPNRQQTFFIYGGKWMADYVSPPGLFHNELFGFSTNHQIVNGSDAVNLEVDDLVFLRPHQSEFVFLQFESLQVVRGGVLQNEWPVFSGQIV